MGARQSKRSVDITTTPKKGEAEVIAEGEGKLEKIGDADIKTTTNGAVPHIEVVEKDETAKDAAAEKETKEEVIENGLVESEDAKTPEGEQSQENLSEPTAVAETNDSKIEDTPETKKQKEKSKKKKWSFRSISFSKKDKQKPSKDSDKNGDVKEVAEENAEETATSPSVESPNSEEAKPTEAVTNGEASPEEVKPVDVPEVPKAPEEAIPEEPAVVAVEEPKVSEPVVEKPAESAPSPAKEQEEPQPVEPPTPAVEETKEVRNEEVPPPLPSSNPPSSVTVFAESTKADALTADQVPVLESPIVRSIVGSPPLAASSPLTKTASESAPVADTPEESVLQQVQETQPAGSDITLPKETVTRETDIEIKDPGTVPSSAQEAESITKATPKIPESKPDVELPLDKKSEVPSESVEHISTEVSESNETEATSEQKPNEAVTEVAAEQNQNESLPEADRDTNPSDAVNVSVTEPSAATPAVVSENCEVPTKSTVSSDVSEPEEQRPLEVSKEISEIAPTPVEPLGKISETPKEVEKSKTLETTEESLPASVVIVPSPESLGEVSESPKEVEESKTLETTEESTAATVETIPSPEPLGEVPESPKEVEETKTLQTTEESPLASIETVPDPEPTKETPPPPVESVEPPTPMARPPSPPQSPSGGPGCGDSLPDSSTESLPSFPEQPASDLEPMSLPPVESAPTPIASDCAGACELPPPSDSAVRMNGTANGVEEVDARTSAEGPIKQVLAEPASEVRQEVGEKKDEDTTVEPVAAVEE